MYLFCLLFLQELEQEKYHLRRRLESAQEEYDLKTHELQSDLQSLQARLDEEQSSSRRQEKERGMLVQTLTEQNGRLASQLRERYVPHSMVKVFLVNMFLVSCGQKTFIF